MSASILQTFVHFCEVTFTILKPPENWKLDIYEKSWTWTLDKQITGVLNLDTYF